MGNGLRSALRRLYWRRAIASLKLLAGLLAPWLLVGLAYLLFLQLEFTDSP
ncbi:MAG TPA: hypothetical protein VGI11_11215 [Variovorax sp.]